MFACCHASRKSSLQFSFACFRGSVLIHMMPVQISYQFESCQCKFTQSGDVSLLSNFFQTDASWLRLRYIPADLITGSKSHFAAVKTFVPYLRLSLNESRTCPNRKMWSTRSKEKYPFDFGGPFQPWIWSPMFYRLSYDARREQQMATRGSDSEMWRVHEVLSDTTLVINISSTNSFQYPCWTGLRFSFTWHYIRCKTDRTASINKLVPSVEQN